MTYDFKKIDEFAWAAVVAAGFVIIQALVTFDPETIVDWETWLVGIGGGAVRAAAAAVIARKAAGG
jgi:hypothetical protein